MSTARVARAFAMSDGAFGLTALKLRIDALDGKVPAHIQTGMYADATELLRRLGLWFLANVSAGDDLTGVVARYRAGADALRGTYSSLVSPYEMADTVARIGELIGAGVPDDVADDVGALPLWSTAPEIVHLAHARGLGIDPVAGAYFAVGTAVGLDRLRGLALRIAATEHWDRLAIRRIVDDLYAGQRALAAQALSGIAGGTLAESREDGAKAVEEWAAKHADALERTKNFLEALERTGDLSIAKLTLASRSQAAAYAIRNRLPELEEDEV